MYCKKCGIVIPEGVRFCPKCGKEVYVPPVFHCAKCGTVLGKDAGFCPKCGWSVNRSYVHRAKDKLFEYVLAVILSLIGLGFLAFWINALF